MAETKAVAKQDEASKALAMEEYSQYAGEGFENQTNEDVALPFFEVLQKDSPECESVPGAKPGMIVNKVTQEVFDGDAGIKFVPAYTEHVYVEWVPREKGGGIVQTHQLGSQVVSQARSKQRFGKFVMDNENELIETFYVYGIMVTEEGEPTPGLIAFSSTKIRPYQSWMTQARSLVGKTDSGTRFPLPLFSHVYRLRSVDAHKKTYKWKNWQVGFSGGSADASRLSTDDPIFQAAYSVKEAVMSGQAKADTTNMTQEGADGDEAPPF